MKINELNGRTTFTALAFQEIIFKSYSNIVTNTMYTNLSFQLSC